MTQEHRIFLRRLRSDLFTAARQLNAGEARYMVDLYYQIQEFRKAAKNQARSDEPNDLISWMGNEFNALEATIKDAMKHYASQHVVGEWSMGLVGVGPVLAAGFLANYDITKAPTAGSLWRYSGLDPSIDWLGKKKSTDLLKEMFPKKIKFDVEDVAAIAQATNRKADNLYEMASTDAAGQPKKLTRATLIAALSKRPYNARMKTLAWKFADCQVKFHNHKNSFYGPLYVEYKAKIVAKNHNKEYSEAAAEGATRVSKTTEAYKYYSKGFLPPGHIEARAKRWTAKLFISHWHSVAYEAHYEVPAPKPYTIAIQDHTHMIEVPR